LSWIITKYLTTALVVVIITEVAKRNDKLGGLIGALPLITIMALVWLYFEKQGYEKIANHAWYTFWYVIPTLPMFLAFPFIYKVTGFWLSLLLCILITGICFAVLAFIVKQFGINLL
tara:strand:+ start:1216 stop:1566 length:351 start_codon:yes stop_codon:yes gene_type:complete